jgi:hypothetical protein
LVANEGWVTSPVKNCWDKLVTSRREDCSQLVQG